MSGWLTGPELAEAAGISPQKARAALARASAGLSWRGVLLATRERRGRGGRSGYQYEVCVDSLPLDLQERLKAGRAADRGPSKGGEAARVEREWRFRVIEPALPFKRCSRERGAAIRAILAQPHHHPVRGLETVSGRSLHRWLDDYDKVGLGGLADRKRKDAGTERVFVSATWDRTAPFDEATKSEFRRVVRQDLRNLWGNGAVYSVVRRLASENLADLTRARGFDPGADELARICLLPKSIVETEREARRVHQYRTDRKAWNDRRGRVRRSPDGL